jgi:hypothetical protein
MKDGLVRTVVATALVTALSVSALAFLVGPRLMKAASPIDGMNVQPALYNGPAQDDNSAQTSASTQNSDPQPQLRRRPPAARSTDSTYTSQTSSQSTYGEPVRHNHRSTEKSALIVAGSAGTGAAIGAIAGGGKGAGIGALAGGAAGLIYDRMTVNK